VLIREEGGAISVMAVIMIFAFLGIMAVVLDLGHLHTVQSELRNAADACALRGARGFYDDTLTGLSATPPNPGPGTNGAIDKASAAIGDNKSDNVALVDLPTADIQVGIWYYDKTECPDPNNQLQPWVWPPASSEWGKHIGPGVSLPTQKTDSYNAGPVALTLANIFGKGSEVPVRVMATAALSGMGGFGPGSPTMPFGPMEPPPGAGTFTGWFRNDNSDTVGWSNLQGVPLGEPTNNTSAKDLKDLLTGNGSPDTGPDHPVVNINNGQIASAINEMTGPNNLFGLVETGSKTNIFQPQGTNADGVAYADVVYLLPVYDKIVGDANKFNQAAVVGAIAVRLVEVGTSPLNYITVNIQSGTYVAPGVGGGPWYGVLSTQPFLVQ
jgi:hypothetical protein